jgi:hypothetical protein
MATGATRSRCSTTTQPEYPSRRQGNNTRNTPPQLELATGEQEHHDDDSRSNEFPLLDFNRTVGMVVEGAPPDGPDTDPGA